MEPLLLASAGERVKLWESNEHGSKLFNDQLSFYDKGVPSVCWAPDNSFLAGFSSTSTNLVVRIITTNPGDEIIVPFEEANGNTCLTINLQSNTVATGSKSGLVHIWDLKNKKLKHTYKKLPCSINCLQYNHDDSLIVSGCDNGKVVFFKRSLVTSLPVVDVLAVRDIKFSRFNVNLLAASCDDGSTYVIDVISQKVQHSFHAAHGAPATCLTFSPINKMLMLTAGLDKKIVCYDVVSKKLVSSIIVDSPLMSMDIHNNGSLVAVGSSKGKIYYYDLRSSSKPMHQCDAHTSSVHCLSFQNKTTRLQDAAKNSSKTRNKPLHVEKTTDELASPCNSIEKTSLNENFDGAFKSNDVTIPSIFSPCKGEGTGPKSYLSKQSLDRFLNGTLLDESGRISGIPSEIFSPLTGTGSSSEATKDKTDLLNFDDLDEKMVQTPHKLSYTGIFSSPYIPVTSQENVHTKVCLTQTPDPPVNKHENKLSSERQQDVEKITAKMINERIEAAGASSGQMFSAESLPVELFRRLVREEVEDCYEKQHRSLIHLQIEMNKKFYDQQEMLKQVLQPNSINSELVNEVRYLKEENERLKRDLNLC